MCFCETKNRVNEKCSNCNKLKLSKEQELCGELKERNQSMIKKKEMFKKHLEKSLRHCIAISHITDLSKSLLDDHYSDGEKSKDDPDYKRLKEYLAEKEADMIKYQQVHEKIVAALKTVDKMQEELRKIKSIDELTAIETETSQLGTQITEEEEKMLARETESDKRLMELNVGNIQKIKKLDKDAKIDEILIAFNSDCDVKETIVTIGLIGDSGTGKSSFINRARCLPDINRHKLNAEPVIECNKYSSAIVVAEAEGQLKNDRLLHFSDPKNKLIEYVDFPGYRRIELEDYYELCTKENCDMFLLLYSRSFGLHDLKLIKYIHQDLKKPIFISKTNIDRSLNDKALLQQCNNDKHKVLEYLREEVKIQDKIELKKSTKIGNIFGSSYDQVKIYLISCIQERLLESVDFNTLIRDMHNSIENRITKDFIIQNTWVLGKELINEKKLSLQERIKTLAVVAGVSEIIPFGGTIVNLAILVGEAIHYQKCFGLTEENLKSIAKILKIDYERIEKIGKIIGITGIKAKYANMNTFVSAILAGLKILISPALNVAVDFASFALVTVTCGASIVITAAASAPLSYFLTKKALNNILDTMEEDSLKLIDLLLEEIRREQ